MPLRLYCPNPSCSEPILYDLTKPNFCPFCSTSLNAGASFANNKPKQSIAKAKIVEEDDDIEIEEETEIEKPINKHKLHGLASKKNKRTQREVDEDEADLNGLNINALQLDIPISDKEEDGVKFEDIAFQQKTGFKRAKPKKVNKKKELELFRTEAGLGGRKDISIEDKGVE